MLRRNADSTTASGPKTNFAWDDRFWRKAFVRRNIDAGSRTTQAFAIAAD
jgi:hypothetical protein